MLLIRSDMASDCVLPHLHIKFGERAFSHAGLAAWNEVPTLIISVSEIDTFRIQSYLKTRLILVAYGVQCCLWRTNAVYGVQ